MKKERVEGREGGKNQVQKGSKEERNERGTKWRKE